MRVTIKGLTDSTITFNSIGIIIRGNSAKADMYPNSIARHIDIKNEEQMRELVCLKNANLISFIDENKIEQVPLSTKNFAITPVKPVQQVQSVQPTKAAAPTIVPPDSTVEDVEAIEDMPVAQPQVEEDVLTITTKKKKNHKKTGKPVGRPKKATSNTTEAKPKISAIKRSKNFGKPIEKNGSDETDSKVVVMTPGGTITGNTVNNMAGDLQESEATRASIEALKKMDSEEAIPDSVIDESNLDVSQKMGQPAVIATGEKSFKKMSMKNSLVPEADAIKKRGIKFIDPNGEDTSVDESVKDIFIDENKDGDDVDFIET